MSTAILITARLRSSRLPFKVIKSILGKPLICHMLDRLKLAKLPEKIIVCTSTVPQDDLLEEIARRESVLCFRGHPDDVLERITHAAGHYGVDTAISCTADNPFVDPAYVDNLVKFHLKERNDYSNIEGLPLGTSAYALAYPAMVRACRIKADMDTETWGGYFTEPGIFKVGTLRVTDPNLQRPYLRLTVDVPEDFELVSEIFKALYVEGQVFSLRNILTWYDDHPEIVRINAGVLQKPLKPIRLKSKGK